MVAIVPRPPSSEGGAQVFDYQQGSPAAVWTVHHNRGAYPAAVEVIDTAGTRIIGRVEHPDANTTIVRFSAPFAGRVRII